MIDSQVLRFAPDVEIQRGGDGRTVHGIVVPWDTPTRVYDSFGPTGRPAAYSEAVARGAFPDALASPRRVKLLGHHNKSVNPLGRGELFRDDAAGLYAEFYVSRTNAGDEVLQLIRDGALDAFSVGFVPTESKSMGDVYVRTAGRLNETSIVTFAAYPDAVVGGVRAQDLSDPTVEPSGAGVGELPVMGGSGDLSEPVEAARTGMTPNERARAIAVANLRSMNP